MKHIWVYQLFVATILTVPASSQVSIFIGIAPPPVQFEAPPPPPPAPECVWIEGFWVPQGHHYHWVSGHYERPPFPGAYWAHPHYEHASDGYRYHAGYWDHDLKDHDRGNGHAYGHYKDQDDHDDHHDNGHGRGHD